MKRGHVVWTVVFGSRLLAGCGSSPPPAQAPSEPPLSAPSPEATSHIADAMEEVDRAEQHIGRVLAPTAGRQMMPEPSDDARTADGACDTACRALDSMGRAADHLCSLTGTRDVRCADARSRFRSASERVHDRCGTCGISRINS